MSRDFRVISVLRPLGRVVVVLALAGSLAGCMEYRIIRWGAPAPELQEQIFASRTIQRAEETFEFNRSLAKSDLDTITVRASNGEWITWSEYMERGRVRAFVVVQNDTILYERYRDGYTDSTLSGSYSMAKSFTSALLGIALTNGSIGSLDDPVTHYLPELSANPAYEGVTLRHALEMRSGFAYSRAVGSPWQQLRSHDARFYYSRNLKRELSRMRRAEAPGGDWEYRDSDTQLLAWVLERATGKSLAKQLEESIWRRIGTEFDASWSLDRPSGSEKAATGLNATARDYARFGRLFLEGGQWQEEEIIPAAWVELSTTLDPARAEPEVPNWWRMQHRKQWWIPMHDWETHQDFYADGAKGQRLYIHVPTRTIIVQLADSDAHDFPFRRIALYLAGEPYDYPTFLPK